MKIPGLSAILFVVIMLVASCGDGLTSRDSVVDMYRRNEETFLQAAREGDFDRLTQVRGVQRVSEYRGCTEIFCGGTGFGPETNYYGVFYSEKDDLVAVQISCGTTERLKPDGAGYRYREPGGDDEYYVEPLGNHYYYYEAHY